MFSYLSVLNDNSYWIVFLTALHICEYKTFYVQQAKIPCTKYFYWKVFLQWSEEKKNYKRKGHCLGNVVNIEDTTQVTL